MIILSRKHIKILLAFHCLQCQRIPSISTAMGLPYRPLLCMGFIGGRPLYKYGSYNENFAIFDNTFDNKILHTLKLCLFVWSGVKKCVQFSVQMNESSFLCTNGLFAK